MVLRGGMKQNKYFMILHPQTEKNGKINLTEKKKMMIKIKKE